MSYTRIWVHCVWTTKNRKPLLTENVRYDVFQHIQENGKEKEIYIDCVNGYLEHVHCLISLKANQNVSDCMQLIKGESSYWVNKNKLTKSKFGWQDDFFAVSVSQSQLHRVRKYIENQEQHHASKSFAQEYNEFMENYGFERG